MPRSGSRRGNSTGRTQVAGGDRETSLDGIFGALSDPIRRGIIARLALGPCSVSQLGEPFEVSAPAISRHLRVLERCGLIERGKKGRVHYCRVVTEPLAEAAAWIDEHQTFWEQQLDSLSEYLDRQQGEPDKEDSTWSRSRDPEA